MKNIPSMLVVLGAIIVLMSQAEAGSLSDVDNKVTGGAEVKPGEVPFLVSLKINTPGKQFRCGGSIIDDRHIITAAHCVNGSITVEVCLGCHKRSECERWFKIDRQWIHPECKVDDLNDIAILRTKNSINFTDLIKPVRLPNLMENDYEIGESLTVAGWGRTRVDQPTTDIARKVDITVKECPRFDKDDSRVCAGSATKGACKGDSGGPLFRINETSRQSTIVGIVSYGYSECVVNGWGSVFTRVSRFLGWIESIKKESQAIA